MDIFKHPIISELSTQDFYEFYNGPFEEFIRGDYEKGTKEYDENIRQVEEFVNDFQRKIGNALGFK